MYLEETLVLEVQGSIFAAGEEKFGVRTYFSLCHLKG